MRQPRPVGFTLIELLVVISIIALLIAILLPALGSARENARLLDCTTRVRGFAVASASYASDNKGYLVYPNWGSSPGGWLYDTVQPNGQYRWPNSYTQAQREELHQTGLLWQYQGRVSEVYYCPDDEGPGTGKFTEAQQPVRTMTSFQFNGATCGYGRIWPKTYRMEQLRSDAVIIWETDENKAGGFWNDGGNRPDEGLSARHRDGAPFGKIDGSTIKITQDEYYDLVKDPNANMLWCNPGKKNGRR